MSVFVSEVLPNGIVFAADRNISVPFCDKNGVVVGYVQQPGSKLLRWPRSNALLGYVGVADVGSKSMHEWLYNFMGDHIAFRDPATVAHDLCAGLQRELGPKADSTIVQFSAYAMRDGL